jgi:hypothetical protein
VGSEASAGALCADDVRGHRADGLLAHLQASRCTVLVFEHKCALEECCTRGVLLEFTMLLVTSGHACDQQQTSRAYTTSYRCHHELCRNAEGGGTHPSLSDPSVSRRVRSAFFDRKLHSRMPLVPTSARLKLLHACDQWNSSRVVAPLPVGTVNCVTALKVGRW